MQSPTLPASFQIQFDSGLAEESVLLAIPGHPDEARFRQAHDRIYEVAEEEERERQFQRLHRRWFQQLELGHPVVCALEEQPTVIQRTRGCRVLPAIFSRDEGADLFGSIPKRVVMRLRPSKILDREPLLAFLRHELMHLADMLDPGFGYEPELPQLEATPALDKLIRDRYRVLWDCWIDGRLLRRGWAPPQVRDRRLTELRAPFPMLGQQCEDLFADWFEQPFQTHQALVNFALDPEIGAEASTEGEPAAGHCSLCQFPSFDLQSGTHLSEEVRQEISKDFPEWKPNQSLCRQCAELYRGRNSVHPGTCFN